MITRVADVDGAITVARPNAAGADALVSYVVPRGSLDVELLRKRLEDVLPSYLVPAAVVVLDAFPLNPSGKIDVKALPAPVLSRGSSGHRCRRCRRRLSPSSPRCSQWSRSGSTTNSSHWAVTR